MSEHRPVILFESRNAGDGGKTGEFLRRHGYLLYGLQQRVGTEPGIDLLPLDSAGASSSNQFNLIAVPIGDEGRWFDLYCIFILGPNIRSALMSYVRKSKP